MFVLDIGVYNNNMFEYESFVVLYLDGLCAHKESGVGWFFSTNKGVYLLNIRERNDFHSQQQTKQNNTHTHTHLEEENVRHSSGPDS